MTAASGRRHHSHWLKPACKHVPFSAWSMLRRISAAITKRRGVFLSIMFCSALPPLDVVGSGGRSVACYAPLMHPTDVEYHLSV